ncbi:hypothetical protein [Bacillus thuringiensis]|uniref:hypothetical protein n=1 Tax=Bacillus thuringiensis TaxID=1428 RepID=UPI003B97E2CF
MKLKVLSTVGLALSLGLTSLGSGGTAFAEKPDDSYFYQIKNKQYNDKAMFASSTMMPLMINTPTFLVPDSQVQKYIFYALDNGYYAIANKDTGNVLTNAENNGWDKTDGARPYLQMGWSNTNDISRKTFRLENEYNGSFVLRNQFDGTIVNGHAKGIVLQRDFANILYNYWEPTNKEHINGNMPQLLPNQSLPDVPKYTGYGQNLPDQTVPVVTGSTIMPAIMVTDSNWSDATKIQNSPYYRLVKKQYWKRLYSRNFTPGSSETVTTKTGMSRVDVDSMVDKTGIEIKADLGASFGGEKASKKGTASLEAKFTKELTITRSTTTTDINETTVEQVVKNPSDTKDFAWAKYALATEYSLERMDGSKVSSPWTVIDGTSTRETSWPSGQQPTVQSTKTISVN